MTNRTADDASDSARPGGGSAHGDDAPSDIGGLVRLLVAACSVAGDAARLTNDPAVDALARKIVAAADAHDTGTRTAVMALRDLVWRVDTARVLIEPRLVDAGCPDLADLLATDDIHALLREMS